eukprot:m.1131933 g.1131933  ORF g.1131933 m.1131933 type:complete len:292 (+) comp24425_c0_seq11:602-1477(+)
MDTSAADAPTAAPAPANFVTESFFLTVRALHVGFIPTVRKYLRTYFHERSPFRQMIRMQHRLRTQGAANPIEAHRQDELKHEVAKQSRTMMCYMTHLHDETMGHAVLNFYAFVCSWLLHIVDPESKGLPLPSDVPVAFKSLPEHIVEDIAEYLVFTAQLTPEFLERLLPNRIATFARFMVTFVGDQTYIRNPYITAKFVEVLSHFTPERRERHSGTAMYTIRWRHRCSACAVCDGNWQRDCTRRNEYPLAVCGWVWVSGVLEMGWRCPVTTPPAPSVLGPVRDSPCGVRLH